MFAVVEGVCVNQIFAMRQLIKKACKHNRKLYMAALDLYKSYMVKLIGKVCGEY